VFVENVPLPDDDSICTHKVLPLVGVPDASCASTVITSDEALTEMLCGAVVKANCVTAAFATTGSSALRRTTRHIRHITEHYHLETYE
jgi:hypothetical protein